MQSQGSNLSKASTLSTCRTVLWPGMVQFSNKIVEEESLLRNDLEQTQLSQRQSCNKGEECPRKENYPSVFGSAGEHFFFFFGGGEHFLRQYRSLPFCTVPFQSLQVPSILLAYLTAPLPQYLFCLFPEPAIFESPIYLILSVSSCVHHTNPPGGTLRNRQQSNSLLDLELKRSLVLSCPLLCPCLKFRNS